MSQSIDNESTKRVYVIYSKTYDYNKQHYTAKLIGVLDNKEEATEILNKNEDFGYFICPLNTLYTDTPYIVC
jgi:hypothetical protein